MTITLRLVKGSALTHSELDGNFSDLDARFPVATANIGDLQVTSGKLATDAVITAKVADEAVTYAKMQHVGAASRLLGRGDSGAGDVEEITLGSGLSMSGAELSASGAGLPADDTTAVVQDPVDNTKRVRIDVGAVATATTRAIIMGDRDVDLSAVGTFAETSHAHSADDITSGELPTARLADGAVTSAKLRNSGALSVIGRPDNSSGAPADISATGGSGGVLRESGSAVGFGTVATAGIADTAVTEAKLAADAVTTAKIANLSVTTAKLDNDAVDGTKLADGAVSSDHLVPGAVNTTQLADDGVTDAKLSHTGVTAGAYNSANITVNAQGRITAASSGASATGLTLTDDSGTTINVDNNLDGTHRQLTSDSAIAVTLEAALNTKGGRVGLERSGAGVVSVSVESGAGYLLPGQDLSDAPATAGFQVAGYVEFLCIGYFGDSTAVADAVWGTPSGNDVTVTSAGAGLPTLIAGQRLAVRNHSNAANNGDYVVTGTPSTSSVDLTKETGDPPEAAAAEAVDIDHGCVYKLYGQDNLADILSADLDCDGFDLLNIGAGSTFEDAGATRDALAIPETIIMAVSDEATALTVGAGKVAFRMPFAMTLSAVRASVGTAPTGAALVVDINEGGTTVLSTKLSIDAGEKTSTTAATPAVISDTALADDAEITIDIDQIGSTVAGAGLKVQLHGVRA